MTEETPQDVLNQIDTIGSLVTAAHSESIKTPLTKELNFTGPQAEAMGSARHLADLISERGGYDVETEYVEEIEPIRDGNRHKMRLIITE